MSRTKRQLDKVADIAASDGNDYRERVAAGLMYKGTFLSFGRNRKKSHPFQKRFGKNEDCIYLHAEIDCLVNATRNQVPLDIISKSTLYVARVKKYHPSAVEYEWGIAKPCVGCQRAIASFDISDVVYTADRNEFDCL